jgi:hypothetical protein
MRSTALQIRVGPREKQGFDEAAKLAGLSFSALARMTLRRAAMREFEDAGRRFDFNTADQEAENVID